MAGKALQLILLALPMIFAIGFLAPVISQAMIAMGWAAPAGLTPLQFGLMLGGAWGMIATITGRWL